MELALTAAALFVGYGYAKSAEGMRDKDNDIVDENYVPKYRGSTNRRMAGNQPMTDEEVAQAYDDFQSRKSAYTVPKFVSFNVPDPGYQAHPIDRMIDPTKIKGKFYENLQHFTSESFETYDTSIGQREPNKSYRGDFSEIGTVRMRFPAPRAKQPFAIKR